MKLLNEILDSSFPFEKVNKLGLKHTYHFKSNDNEYHVHITHHGEFEPHTATINFTQNGSSDFGKRNNESQPNRIYSTVKKIAQTHGKMNDINTYSFSGSTDKQNKIYPKMIKNMKLNQNEYTYGNSKVWNVKEE